MGLLFTPSFIPSWFTGKHRWAFFLFSETAFTKAKKGKEKNQEEREMEGAKMLPLTFAIAGRAQRLRRV